MSVVLMLILQSAGAALPIDFDLAHLPARDRLATLRRGVDLRRHHRLCVAA